MIDYSYTIAKATIHQIKIDNLTTVKVEGDPENGFYEWVVFKDEGRLPMTVSHSDSGYGSPEVALRDALIFVLGLPDDEKEAQRQAKITKLAQAFCKRMGL